MVGYRRYTHPISAFLTQNLKLQSQTLLSIASEHSSTYSRICSRSAPHFTHVFLFSTSYVFGHRHFYAAAADQIIWWYLSVELLWSHTLYSSSCVFFYLNYILLYSTRLQKLGSSLLLLSIIGTKFPKYRSALRLPQ